MKHIVHPTYDEVVQIYKDMMQLFGGSYGIRDVGLLESALAQGNLVVFGEHVHKDIFDMAAAYCFHIVKNHPFFDGNKRTGLLVALTFLQKNGITVAVDSDVLYRFAIGVANSEYDKPHIAKFFRDHSEQY